MTETEKYLYRYYQLERMKATANNDLSAAMEEYAEKAQSLLKPLDMSEVKVGKTNRISNPVEAAVLQMVVIYQKEIEKAKKILEELINEQDAIRQTIEKADLNIVEKSYVISRYFKGKQSWQTAQQLQYSDRQANRYRGSALRKIEAVLKDGR